MLQPTWARWSPKNNCKRVCGYLDSGFSQGAKALAGGQKAGDKGYFVEPTVLVNTNGRHEGRAGGDLRTGGGGDCRSRTSTRS